MDSVSNEIPPTVNFPTWIPECASHNPALLDFFHSSASICYGAAFSLLGNTDQYLLSVSFRLKWKGEGGPFHYTDFDYLCTDWNCLHNHLRGEQWKYIFKVSAFAAAATTELCKWVQFERDVYIPQGKYQVKPYSSPWNLVACAAAIAHTN